MTNLDILTLKASVSIPALLHARGLLDRMSRRGNRLVGACPIHHGDNPTAFSVDLQRNLWYCYTGCDTGGDVIDLVRRLDGVGFREALRVLAGVAALPPPPSLSTAPSSSSSSSFRPYTRSLWLQPDHPFLRRKGILLRTAARFEVGAYDGPGWLSGCIGVRLHDPEGHPLGYAGRALDSGSQKWKLPPGFPKGAILYGLHHVRQQIHRGLVVVECPWGALRLAQLDLPAVALLGVHVSDAQKRLLAAAHHLVLLLDGDEAGRRGARRIQRELGSTMETVALPLPDDTDPDDLSDEALANLVAPWIRS
jgi:DNA primase